MNSYVVVDASLTLAGILGCDFHDLESRQVTKGLRPDISFGVYPSLPVKNCLLLSLDLSKK